VFSLAFGFLFRLADGPLLGGLLDLVVLRWLVWVGFSGAWFLAALLTAALPLQVFAPGDLSPVSRTLAG
jgi:hypothetical protein